MADISNGQGNEQDIFPKAAEPLLNMWRSAVIDIPATIAADTLRFTAQRLHSQSDYLNCVLNCATVPEVVDLNAKFVHQAVNDYGTEANKLILDVRETLLKRMH